jgi:hypothetical protein
MAIPDTIVTSIYDQPINAVQIEVFYATSFTVNNPVVFLSSSPTKEKILANAGYPTNWAIFNCTFLGSEVNSIGQVVIHAIIRFTEKPITIFLGPPGAKGSIGTTGSVGPSGSGFQVVANIAALSAIVVIASDDGAPAYVLSVEDVWVYHTNSVLTPDGITIAVANGPGNWERLNLGSVEWREQPTWFVNPTTGNDENDGLTSPSAIKTLAELTRRWGKNPIIPQATNVTLLENIPNTDSLQILDLTTGSTTLFFNGVTTPLLAGTLVSFAGPDNVLNVLTKIEGAGSFAAYVGKRITITSGGAVGAVAWIQRDDGGNFASTSQFTLLLGLSSPTAGDTYIIEDLSTMQLEHLTTSNVDSDLVSFIDVSLLVVGDVGNISIFGCDLTSSLFASSDQLMIVGSSHPGAIYGSFSLTIKACVGYDVLEIQNAAGTSETTASIESCSAVGTTLLIVNTASTIFGDDLAIFDVIGSGIKVNNGGILYAGPNKIWGNNVEIGFEVNSGGAIKTGSSESSFPVPGEFLTIVTTTADASIDGIIKTYAQLPYANKLTGSCIDGWSFVYGPGGVSDIATAPLVTANKDNYNLDGDEAGWARAETVRIAADMAGWSFSGFQAVSSDIYRKTLINTGAFTWTINNLDVGSDATNQALIAGGNLAVPSNGSAIIEYDLISLIWRVI